MGNLNDLSDLYHVQKSLEESKKQIEDSERKYRLIAENIFDGIVVFDDKNEVVYESPSYIKLTTNIKGKGTPKTSQEIINIMHPDDRVPILEKVTAAQKNRRDKLIYNFRIKNEKGKYIWREDHAQFYYKENGDPLGTYVIARDITHQKEAEKTIREHLKQYHAIIQTSSDGFFIINMDAEFLDVNHNLCAMLGYSREQLLTMKLSHVEVMENANEIKKHIEKIRKLGYDIFESRFKTKSGQVFDIEVSASYWSDKQRVFSFIRDITAKKEAAQQLIESEQRLHEAQQMAHLGNWEYYIDDDKFWMSNETQHIFGVTLKNNCVPFNKFLNLHSVELQDVLKDYIKSVISNNSQSNLEYRYKRLPDNDFRFIYLKGELRLKAKGEPDKVVGVIQDITIQKTLENELRKLTNAIEQNPTSILITDLNGAIEYVNPKFTELTGYSSNEVLGKNPRILKSGLNKTEIYDDLWKTIKKKVLPGKANYITKKRMVSYIGS